jgi:hypothetical protein
LQVSKGRRHLLYFWEEASPEFAGAADDVLVESGL